MKSSLRAATPGRAPGADAGTSPRVSVQPGPASCTDGASRKTPVSFRRHKYGAKRTQVNGIWFMSKAEATRYAELDLLQKAGKIRNLILQPRYSLTAGHGIKIGEYRADFEYQEQVLFAAVPPQTAWRKVAEDVKGFPTDLFKWKAKHFRAEYKAIELREIRK